MLVTYSDRILILDIVHKHRDLLPYSDHFWTQYGAVHPVIDVYSGVQSSFRLLQSCGHRIDDTFIQPC